MRSVREDEKETVGSSEQRTFESIDDASTRWHLIRRSGGVVSSCPSPLTEKSYDDIHDVQHIGA